MKEGKTEATSEEAVMQSRGDGGDTLNPTDTPFRGDRKAMADLNYPQGPKPPLPQARMHLSTSTTTTRKRSRVLLERLSST